MVPALAPTAYHRAVRTALQVEEPGLWAWFSSDSFGDEQREHARLELLRSTVRLERASHAALYGAADEVARRLALDVPVTFYQGEDERTLNAGLCFIPGEAHIVLAGPISSRLDRAELRALVGHELAHLRLWSDGGGAFRVADALVETVAASPRAPASWVQLALRQRRYTEVYADRGSLVATDGDLDAALRCLLKVSAGLETPDAVAYLRQVDDLLGRDADASRGESHPELFLRAWALRGWLAHGDAIDAQLAERIQGRRALQTLDLLQQRELATWTRELVEGYLARPGLRSEAIVAQARQYFPDLDGAPRRDAAPPAIAGSCADYFGYVLLDLATADRELGDAPLAAALACADACGFADAFDRLARKELRLSAAAIADVRRRWPELARQLDLEPA